MIATTLLLSLLANDAAPQPDAFLGQTRVYRVRQTTKLDGIADGAGKVRWWISLPDDDRFQDVLDLAVVSTPGPWRIEREPEHGNRFLYVEAQDPAATSLEAVVEFTLRRQPVLIGVDPDKVGALTDVHRQIFAAEVARDEPHMEVTARIAALADEVCGDERNPARAARALLQHVADNADHYSKDATKPKCGIGDANDCLVNEGGCCTDLHSLFIALARSRGIPARLQMGYRLLEKNEGREVDPGYRCWAEYFLPSYGWVPADIVEADATDGLGPERWFSGLTERRLWLNEGREFQLAPDQAGSISTMSLGYAEVDGQVARVRPDGDLPAQLTRTVRFVEVRGDEVRTSMAGR
jgi:hypothetical protein